MNLPEPCIGGKTHVSLCATLAMCEMSTNLLQIMQIMRRAAVTWMLCSAAMLACTHSTGYTVTARWAGMSGFAGRDHSGLGQCPRSEHVQGNDGHHSTSLMAAKRVKKMDASSRGSASRRGTPVSRPAATHEG